MAQQQKTRMDVVQEITDRFIEMFEDGIARPGNWTAPWRRVGDWARNAETGKAYQGQNQWMLGSLNSIWATYRQWNRLGCQVRKGEMGMFGVKWIPGKLTKAEEATKAHGEKVRNPGMFPSVFFVHNIDQVVRRGPHREKDQDGNWSWKPGSKCRLRGTCTRPIVVEDAVTRVRARHTPAPLTPMERHEAAELANNALTLAHNTLGVKLHHDGNDAFYSRERDTITLPKRDQFKDMPSYVSVKGHEIGHATGAKSRLDRETLANYHVHEERAKEELVAELTTAALMRHLNVEDQPREDHAHYLKSWAMVLKDSKWALNQACKASEQALAMILEAAGLNATADVEPAPEAAVYDDEVKPEPAPAKPKRARKPKLVVVSDPEAVTVDQVADELVGSLNK